MATRNLSSLELFATRLRTARVMRQLSMDDLLGLLRGVKISKPAISKYENAKMMPSDDVRKALAEALGVDEAYFSRPLVCTPESFEINFRKKSSMKVAAVNALSAKVRDKVERYLEIEEILQRAEAGAPIEELPQKMVSTKEEAKAFALEVRQKWNLGNFPIVNVQSELERHGIKVIPIEESDEFDGLSGTIDNDKVFVAINSNPNKTHVERRRLTVMHEVGHQLMTFPSTLASREVETLCNVFANEMLITTEAFQEQLRFETRTDLLALRPLQLYYGISIDALMKKAEETGRITSSNYTYYNIYKNQSRNFKNAVEQSLYQESPIYDRFLSLVLKAYVLKIIDRMKAESLLYDVPEENKRDLLAI